MKKINFKKILPLPDKENILDCTGGCNSGADSVFDKVSGKAGKSVRI